ncbi:fibrobacter succinogenes major paralogous domain-containing protein [Fibrobacter sp.]|uniref:fibrobacter succinogenes major paralogous domain-containing protein n=1 Tax=Fibrobacter sp. TaxID=35828 RepID=UPI0025BDF5F8|nr:fibrobacter succinogenes major paralogous domain-containing protein [Fibrobacter sp.]MBR3072690.1 fibrobacter succinogenes major paralogous domain-containing protein [Fibrobacter sp.]
MKLLIPSLLALFFVACDNGSSTSATSSLSDAGNEYNAVTNTLKDYRNGQIYKTVTIGTQTWMAQNLNYESANSYCYNDNASNCTKYGRLYTWAAAVGKSEDVCGYDHSCSLPSGYIQGVCPSSWHLPTKTEWETLITAVGGPSTAAKILKSTSGWNNDGNGTDAFSFSALPAGYRDYNWYYDYKGLDANFRSSTEYGSGNAYFMYLGYYDDNAGLYDVNKGNGFSVRCLKD